MRLTLTILALIADVLIALLLVSVIAFGKVDAAGMMVGAIFIGVLALNGLAIIFCRRPRIATTVSATAHTFD